MELDDELVQVPDDELEQLVLANDVVVVYVSWGAELVSELDDMFEQVGDRVLVLDVEQGRLPSKSNWTI